MTVMRTVIARGFMIGLMLVILGGCMKDRSLDFPIVSVERKSELHGNWFFLGRGHLDEQWFYYTYVVFPNGGLRLLGLAADSTVIYETDEQPHVYLHLRMDRPISLDTVFKDWPTSHRRADLYVPIGTVFKEFRIGGE